MIRAFARVALLLFFTALLTFGIVFTQTDLLDGLAADNTPGAATLARSAQTEALTFFGSLEVADTRAVVLGASGQIQDVLVEVGDLVQADQELLQLDTTNLDWDVQRAENNLEMARVALLELGDQSSESELAVAEANLELARANLAKLEAGGVTDEERAAAQASANAAWARYNEVRAGPSEARLQQLRANLEKAQVNETQAQRAYNEVKWRDDVGRTPQAAALQRATIDLTAAQAAYNEATQPAKVSEVQSALAAAQRAQHALNELDKGVSAADLAVARARVSSAEAAVKRVKELAGSGSQRTAELRVSQALISLEEAQRRRNAADVTAPMAGMVLSLNGEEGQMGSSGSTVAVIGDPGALELVIGIPQDQVLAINEGDPVTIARFGNEEVTVVATVAKISPISLPGKGNATFPVTIRLPQDSPELLGPGVFVSANFGQ